MKELAAVFIGTFVFSVGVVLFQKYIDNDPTILVVILFVIGFVEHQELAKKIKEFEEKLDETEGN